MKRSTLVPGPHRMPPRTHRRTDLADLPVERPDVTTEAWVGWFERSLREEPVESEPLEPVAVLEPSPPPEPEPEPVPEHPLVPELVTEAPPATAPEASASPPEPARRTGVLVGAAAAVVLALVAGTWWWHGPQRARPDAARPAGRGVQPSEAPPVPVALPAGGRHTEVRVLASGDLDVQEWLRSPDGSVAYDRYRLTGALQRNGTRALATSSRGRGAEHRADDRRRRRQGAGAGLRVEHRRTCRCRAVPTPARRAGASSGRQRPRTPRCWCSWTFRLAAPGRAPGRGPGRSRAR